MQHLLRLYPPQIITELSNYSLECSHRLSMRFDHLQNDVLGSDLSLIEGL
ncbi:MAG: hypothetical protein MJK04_28580 [Psychrosphaera sp.]|nr:hypothetical protein [Psychrosphaera sp.]